jgi:hypothetical protein
MCQVPGAVFRNKNLLINTLLAAKYYLQTRIDWLAQDKQLLPFVDGVLYVAECNKLY